jgi:hypothetical protein
MIQTINTAKRLPKLKAGEMFEIRVIQKPRPGAQVAAPRPAPKTPVAPAPRVYQGKAMTVAERDALLASDDAQGRQDFAIHLNDIGFSYADAKLALAAAPRDEKISQFYAGKQATKALLGKE